MPLFFHHDQIGSLLRPQKVIEASRASTYYSDEASPGTDKAIQEAIQEVVQKQLQLNIRPLMTGEFERTIFYNGIFENLSGMTVRSDLPVPSSLRPGLPLISLLERMGIKQHSAVVATGKIQHVKSAYLAGWDVLKGCVPPEKWAECKITIPSPTWQHLQLARGTAFTSEAYASDREYFSDLSRAYQRELTTLYDAGLRAVQIDDPNLTYFVSEEFRDGCRADGIDPEDLLDLYIWAHNECLKGHPSDMHLGIHLCRGNFPGSTSILSGSYEMIAEKVLTKMDYDSFYLEFDDERSGSFEALRHVPKGKRVVLGLVSTKKPELEDIDKVISRVREATEIIARGQERCFDDVLQDTVAVSPQCGFSSSNHGGGIGMTEERQWEKLVLVREVSERLWPEV
jgi:methionine synthase II (cobalamin-independent)